MWCNIMQNQSFLLYDIFSNNVLKNPNKIAIIFNNIKITYNEVKRRADKLANWFTLNGYRKGDITVVHLPNSPDFLIAHLAISKLGGIISTMHMPYARADIKNALEEIKPAFIITESRYKNTDLIKLFEELSNEIGISPRLIFRSEEDIPSHTTLERIYKDSNITNDAPQQMNYMIMIAWDYFYIRYRWTS